MHQSLVGGVFAGLSLRSCAQPMVAQAVLTHFPQVVAGHDARMRLIEQEIHIFVQASLVKNKLVLGLSLSVRG